MFNKSVLVMSLALNALVGAVAAFGVGYICGNIEKNDAKTTPNQRPASV